MVLDNKSHLLVKANSFGAVDRSKQGRNSNRIAIVILCHGMLTKILCNKFRISDGIHKLDLVPTECVHHVER